MTRFLRYFVLLAALVLWLGGFSSTVSHWLYETGIIVDDYRHGDLYRISALPQFKDNQPDCPPAGSPSDTASTHLYIIGDSFSEPQRMGQADFSVSHFQRVKWDFQQRVQLDTTKRNVLLLESIERHFRQHFVRPTYEFVVEKDTASTPPLRRSWRQQLGDDLHLSDMEERLASALFSHDWAFWFKEQKATLTQRLFNRWSSGVSLSRNQEHIFIGSDTDSTQAPLSSFSKLDDAEVNTLVDSVNAVADRYKRLGFDEVYLAIIPNKVTILEPNRGTYNHLIERIQQHPDLRVKPVDVYSIYKNAPSSPYLLGDTHWNCKGRQLWLQQVQQLLRI